VTYGVAAIRQALGSPAEKDIPSLGLSLLVTLGFCVATYAASWLLVARRRKVA